MFVTHCSCCRPEETSNFYGYEQLWWKPLVLSSSIHPLGGIFASASNAVYIKCSHTLQITSNQLEMPARKSLVTLVSNCCRTDFFANPLFFPIFVASYNNEVNGIGFPRPPQLCLASVQLIHSKAMQHYRDLSISYWIWSKIRSLPTNFQQLHSGYRAITPTHLAQTHLLVSSRSCCAERFTFQCKCAPTLHLLKTY